MESTHSITVQVTITYDGNEVAWSNLLENAVEEIAEESSMTDAPIVLAEVSVERID